MVAAFVEAGLLSAPGCAAARALPKLRQVAARSLRPALASQRRRCLASRAPGLRVLCSGGEASSLNILLTGGSRGIGFEAAAKFLEQGHTLLIPCRSAERCAETERNLRSRVPNTGSIKTLTCDLASLQQVRRDSLRLGVPCQQPWAPPCAASRCLVRLLRAGERLLRCCQARNARD